MQFFKYQGTGNDFIIIDGRENLPAIEHVEFLCDRRFGIGADGLMILKNHEGYDFEMVYYNSDGKLSSMCGNGGRCLAHFANWLNLGREGHLDFIAVDGPHHAFVNNDFVELGMRDVTEFEKRAENIYVLNTGSPHYVIFLTENISEFDVVSEAKKIRYNNEFKTDGINVNFVNITGENSISIRTYERGVEDETLSCGTGVTAASLAFQIHSNRAIPLVNVKSMGGNLQVQSEWLNNQFKKVILAGPAIQVFSGILP